MSKNTTRAIIATSIATALTASLFASSADAAPRRHREPKVPQRVALTARDFGQRVPLTLDTGNYADQPASDGQYCDASGNGATGSEPRPIGGRQWNWLTRDQSTLIAEIVTPIQLRCSRAAKVPRGTAMRIDRTMAAMTRIAVTWTLSTMTGVISAPVT